MEKNNVIELIQPGEFKDHLTEILRQGAQTLVFKRCCPVSRHVGYPAPRSLT